MEKDKRHMEASWWERMTVGELGLVLMARAMFSKSLIQFSFDGRGFVLTMVGVRKVMVNFFRDFVFIPGQISLQ